MLRRLRPRAPRARRGVRLRDQVRPRARECQRASSDTRDAAGDRALDRGWVIDACDDDDRAAEPVRCECESRLRARRASASRCRRGTDRVGSLRQRDRFVSVACRSKRIVPKREQTSLSAGRSVGRPLRQELHRERGKRPRRAYRRRGARQRELAVQALLGHRADELEAEPGGLSDSAAAVLDQQRVSAPRRSRTTIGGAPWWNAFVISSFAIRPSFCAVAASNVARFSVDRRPARAQSAAMLRNSAAPSIESSASDNNRCTVAIERMRAADSSKRAPSAPRGGQAAADRPPSAGRS